MFPPYRFGNPAAMAGLTQTVLTLQPDATAGIDTFIWDFDGTNFGTYTFFDIGSFSGAVRRALLKFDLSSIPAGATIQSAVLSLYATDDFSANARTFRVYRQKRAWTEGGANKTTYDGTNNWQVANGFGADDCEQTDIGSRAFTATETLNEFKDFTLTASSIQEMITGGSWTNNGFMVKADTEVADDGYRFSSSDHATAAQRPRLVVTYFS